MERMLFIPAGDVAGTCLAGRYGYFQSLTAGVELTTVHGVIIDVYINCRDCGIRVIDDEKRFAGGSGWFVETGEIHRSVLRIQGIKRDYIGGFGIGYRGCCFGSFEMCSQFTCVGEIHAGGAEERCGNRNDEKFFHGWNQK